MEEQCGQEATRTCRDWWRFRTRLERRLLITVIATSLTLFAIVTYAFFIRIASGGVAPVCASADCVRAAAKFLQSIDAEADPCQDFARFACGGFFAGSHPNVTASELAESEFSARRRLEDVFAARHAADASPAQAREEIAPRNLRRLFAACMNRSAVDAGVAHLKRELIAPLGGWPLISNDWEEGFAGHTGVLNFNWMWLNFLSKLRRLGFRSDMFFGVKLYANFAHNRNYATVTPPTLGDVAASREFRKENEAFLYRTLEAFGGDKTRAAYDVSYLGDFTLEFIKIVAKFNNRTEPKQRADAQPELLTLQQVQKLTASDQIDWTQLLSTLAERRLQPGDSIIFDLQMREYLRDLQTLLKQTPRRVLVNYIIWEVLKDMQLWYSVPNAPRITAHQRRHLCVDEVNKIMPLIANQELAKEVTTRGEVKKMVFEIREEITSKLSKVEWLSDEMRRFLAEKLNNVKFFIGGKLDSSDFKVDYGTEDIGDSDNYVAAISRIKLQVDKFHYDVLFDKTTLETTLIRLLSMDASANAFYLTNNYVGIPSGLVQTLYSESLPNCVNYARLGHLIGHELSHIFSLFAQQYGVRGEPNPLWDAAALRNHTKHHECLAEEYEEYYREQYSLEINGSLALDENVADLVGTRAAYEVFLRLEPAEPARSVRLPAINNFTARQLFWLAFARYYCDPREAGRVAPRAAEVHGVPSFRIFSALKKSQRFAVDFKCKKGSRMNPLRKCVF